MEADHGMTPTTIAEDALCFLHPETRDNPFPVYDHILRERPIYFDPKVRLFIVSRYDDIRRILMDPKTFSSAKWKDAVRDQIEDAHAVTLRERFALMGGFVPAPNVASLDDPRHRDVRALFDKAFRPARVKAMEAGIRNTATRLIDGFADKGACEIVQSLSIPFPMTVIFNQIGARLEDMGQVKQWLNAIIERVSFCQTPEQQMHSVDQTVEAQLYLKTIVTELRGNPTGTLLSDLVNTPLADGSFLTEEELITNIIDILFQAGTETTTNAITSGVRMLCEQPDLFARLKANPDLVRGFVEEVLRLESPAQGIFRVVTRDVEMHGLSLPRGSILHLRVAAANRDETKFACPAHIDLDRKNAGTHLAFGAGIHHCAGAVLARNELHWSFRTLVDRFGALRISPRQGSVSFLRNYMFRSIDALHIEFERG